MSSTVPLPPPPLPSPPLLSCLQMRSENGSPRLLRNIERLSTQVARSLVFSTNTSSVTTTHNIGKIARLRNTCPTHWCMFFSLHICLINLPILVITAFTLDQNQEQDVRFQSADFAEIGTNIVRDDVPSAVLPGRLLRDAQPVQNIGLAPVQIPVAFTVTRNADLYLPRTLNNGRYSRCCGGVGGTEASVGACMRIVLYPRSLTGLFTLVASVMC